EGAAAERDAAAEATERPRAAAEARAIEAAMQAANAPVPALVAALDALKAQYRWIQRFETVSEPGGVFVWMIGSRIPIGFHDPNGWGELFEERHLGKDGATQAGKSAAAERAETGARQAGKDTAGGSANKATDATQASGLPAPPGGRPKSPKPNVEKIAAEQ